MSARADALRAREFGVSTANVTAIRVQHLIKGVHYTTAGNKLDYTPEGLLELAKHLKADPKNIAPEKKGEAGPAKTDAPTPSASAGPITATIIRRCPNPTWIVARLPDGQEVPCRVNNNARLSVSDQIQIAHNGQTFQQATAR